jgi:serine/threonine protein kinase
MAPEQVMGSKHVGPSADVWALGLVLYECLAGRRLWRDTGTDDDVNVTAYMNVSRTILSAVGELGDGVPLSMREIVVQALQVEPRERIALTTMFDVLATYASVCAPQIPPAKEGDAQIASRNGVDELETNTHTVRLRDASSPNQHVEQLESTKSDESTPKLTQSPHSNTGPAKNIRATRVPVRRPAIAYVAMVSAFVGVGVIGIGLGKSSVPPNEFPMHEARSSRAFEPPMVTNTNRPPAPQMVVEEEPTPRANTPLSPRSDMKRNSILDNPVTAPSGLQKRLSPPVTQKSAVPIALVVSEAAPTALSSSSSIVAAPLASVVHLNGDDTVIKNSPRYFAEKFGKRGH